MTLTFGDLGRIFDGPHATPSRTTFGPYFLNIASLQKGRLQLDESDHLSEEDFARWTRRVQPTEGDLLFSYETRLGDAALMPAELRACLGRRMALLRPNQSLVNSDFLLYYYLSPSFQSTIEQNTVHGATVNRISLSTMGSWPVGLPAMKEQTAIAEVLRALDDKIALNLRSETLLDCLLATHYQAAIVSKGRPERRPFFDAIEVTFGEPFSGSEFSEPGVGRPLIRIRDLKTFDSQVWTTEVRTRETVVCPGDVVVGMDAEFRPVAWLGRAGMLNQRVCVMRSVELGDALVREIIRAPLAAIEQAKSGTTVIHLNKGDLQRAAVVIPPPEAVGRFREVADKLYLYRVQLARERASLGNMRDMLLPELMSGRLRVRDAEKQVEAVV